jgi:hypothetical protein
MAGFCQVPSTSSFLWDVGRRRLVGYRRFGKTYRSHLQRSSSQWGIVTVHIIMHIWNKTIYCTPLHSNLQGTVNITGNYFSYKAAVLLTWLSSYVRFRKHVRTHYLPLMGAFPCEWHQEPSGHEGLYTVREAEVAVKYADSALREFRYACPCTAVCW